MRIKKSKTVFITGVEDGTDYRIGGKNGGLDHFSPIPVDKFKVLEFWILQ
jgi:hypothetical protein